MNDEDTAMETIQHETERKKDFKKPEEHQHAARQFQVD